jgi:hypothetical protein
MNPAARRQAEACQPATMFRKSPYNKYQWYQHLKVW